MGTVFQLIIMRLLVLSISIALASAKGLPHRPNMTVEAAANCDPDYGWINGPDGTNKCYMVLRDSAYAACFGCGGSYYNSFNWFEAMQCCVANHGYLVQPSSQEEHALIKERLSLVDGEVFTSYWLGGREFYAEGTWQWVTGEPSSYTQWHEGEPNNVENED